MSQPDAVRALAAEFTRIRQLDVPINQKLAHYSQALAAHLPHYADAAEKLIARLKSAATGSAAPDVGMAMPPFLLPNAKGRLVGLQELLGHGPLAVVFFRGHWCPYCRLTTHALAAVDVRIRSFGGRIVAITPERQHYLALHQAESEAQFHILSDIGKGYAASLNLLIWIGTELQETLQSLGRDLNVYQGDDTWFLPVPACFVLSRDGVIRSRFIDPDYRRRIDTEDFVHAMEAAGQAAC